MVVEAGDVGACRVDFGRAGGHPFGHSAGDARRFLDPDGRHRPQPFDLRRLADEREAVGRQRQQAVDGVADGVVAEHGHQFQGALHRRLEVVLGEGHLGRRKGGLFDGRDVVGIHQDRPVVIGADFHVTTVLALVGVEIHVADDGVVDLAWLLGQHGDRPDADHLVDGGRQGDAGPGHLGDARTPDAAADDDDLGRNVPLIGAHAAHAAIDHIHAGDLDAREDAQRTLADGIFAHQRAGPQRIDRADAGGVKGACEDLVVDERHHGLDFGRGNDLRLDAPRLAGDDAAL